MRTEVKKTCLLVALCAQATVGGAAHAALAFSVFDDATVDRILNHPLVIEELSVPGKEEVTVTRALPWYGAWIRDGRLVVHDQRKFSNTAYILSRSNKVLGVATMFGNPKKPRFNGLHDKPLAEKLDRALRIAAALPQVRRRMYAARILSIPSVSSVAIWLKGKEDDLFIPLPQTFEPLKAYKVYGEGEFLKALENLVPKHRQRYG